MSNKKQRHTLIKNILQSYMGTTHEEIKALLQNEGIHTSQATLSRDLREIGASKMPGENGGYVYRLNDGDIDSKTNDLKWVMEDFCIGYEPIGNFLVIRTKPGNARDFCLIFDRQIWKEVAGTLAGDDTVLVITRSLEGVNEIINKLEKISGKANR